MRRVAPYGSWASPLGAEHVAAVAVGFADVAFDGDAALWTESRPAEKGRCVVVRCAADGMLTEAPAAPISARTRVHEYGGRPYASAAGVLWFSHFADQRLYRIDPGAELLPITPPAALRYADIEPDAKRGLLWCVREDHRDGGEPKNQIVALDAAGDDAGGRIVVTGPDFVGAPRLSPDGTQLAWLAWHHPDMPWDGCELWLARVDDAGGLHDAWRVAGGRGEAVQQPVWSPDGVLHFVSDRSGWWNLYRWREGVAEPLCPMAAEFGAPTWNLGLASYAFGSARQLLCVIVRDAVATLASLDTATRELSEIATPYTSFGSVAAASGKLLFTAASPQHAARVCTLELSNGAIAMLRESSTVAVDPAYTSWPQAIDFSSDDGAQAHAFFYPPANADFEAPPGEKPPLIVIGHGGPTGMASNAWRAGIQYWTSRGFAVLDVNYRGSSGFGRDYRRALDGRWGVADVADCSNGARFLARRGDVDARRLIIRGSSAGGYTTLCALTFGDTFACGASLYGIGDLEALARDTHKFESRYLERLVGPYPQARTLYRERSPIHHVERLRCPLILLQGADDRVVPPEQSRRMHAALKAKGVPVAYLEFAGEQHGFRDANNIARALEAEATFYARVFGFDLADTVAPVPIDNL